MQHLQVQGGHLSDIYLGRGLINQAGARAAALGSKKCLVVTDSNVSPLYGQTVLNSLEKAGLSHRLLTLPAGEKTKTLEGLYEIYAAMDEMGLSRSDMALALGGGVVGDMAGFAAATYLRGIRLMQIPTSLLAQVDSSVGGKTAVDFKGGKNRIGSFYQPHVVLADPDVLSTLPPREWACGMGEVVKYMAAFDETLLDTDDMEKIIHKCLVIKAGIAQRDEKDTGERMLLNFGHTLGHAIETAMGLSGYRHGEAVGAGMCLITRKTEEMGLTKAGTAQRLEEVCIRHNLPRSCPRDLWPQVKQILLGDKKWLDGRLNLVVIEQMGRARLHSVDGAFLEGMEQWMT